MLVHVFAWSLLVSAPDFDSLAKARNADGLLALSGPEVKAVDKPFNFLRVNGPYQTGRFGWTALPLSPTPTEKYIVFSTKITSEDYGEFVFQTDGQKLTKYIPEGDNLGFKIEHQKLDIRFEPAAKSCTILTEVEFRRTGPAKPGFLIRMSPQYKVLSVSENGSPVQYAQAGGVIWLKAPTRDHFSCKISYKGIVDLPLYAGSITTKEATLTNDYWYPMIARQPAAFETTTHVQKEWTVVAQGEPVGDSVSGNERTVRYRMDLPVTYWSLSAGPYRHFMNTINGRKYQVWSPNLSDDQMRIQTELYAPIIEFYSSNFAPYPFSIWGALDSPQYGGGALEAYSYATYGGGLPAEDAHEPAHTWWGGMVDNTYLKSLWNESFANYCSALYRREGPIGNQEEKRYAFIDDAAPEPTYLRLGMSNSGALSGPLGSTLGYGKGAKVLQMLEMELGRESMMKAMSHWVKSQPKGQPGEWEDFERAVKESSGRDMKQFFDEWVRRPGYADFEVENLKWEDGKLAGDAVFKAEPYHLLLDVMLDEPGQVRHFEPLRLEPVGNRAHFSLPSPKKPAIVSFDPWMRLLRRYGSDEKPMRLQSFLANAKRYDDPAHLNWLKGIRGAQSVDALPDNLDGMLIVGSPESLSALKPLCALAHFTVSGNTLTYEGTTIDLSKGTALAIVDLPNGGHCAIGLGTSRRPPDFGRARLGLFDDLGRMLRGRTDPKSSGFLTYKL